MELLQEGTSLSGLGAQDDLSAFSSERAVDCRSSAHEVAPASRTPRDRSPRRLARPTLATRSRVDSLPSSAAAAIRPRHPAKGRPAASAASKAALAGASASTSVLSPTLAP